MSNGSEREPERMPVEQVAGDVVGGYFLAMMSGEPWLFEVHPGHLGPYVEPPSSEPVGPLPTILAPFGPSGVAKSLDTMMHEVVVWERSKGWLPNDNQFGTSLALLHSEVSEMLEAYRSYGFRKRDVVDQRAEGDFFKPEDVASEAADVLIRLLSTFAQFLALEGFDLEAEYERKMAYNRTRSHRHGGKSI